MKISELIIKLEECRKKYGDIEVSNENDFIFYNTEYNSEDNLLRLL